LSLLTSLSLKKARKRGYVTKSTAFGALAAELCGDYFHGIIARLAFRMDASGKPASEAPQMSFI
jgi:hypothetical protein